MGKNKTTKIVSHRRLANYQHLGSPTHSCKIQLTFSNTGIGAPTPHVVKNPHITYSQASVSVVPPHLGIHSTVDRVILWCSVLKKVHVDMDKGSSNPCCSRPTVLNFSRFSLLTWKMEVINAHEQPHSVHENLMK